MRSLKISIAVFLLAACGLGSSAAVTGSDAEGITENACARLQDAEIVWDLSKFRWVCCVIKNENEYETCIPITDMRPLPKTSIVPFPPNSPRTVKPENQKE
jgi:hypothetical protein